MSNPDLLIISNTLVSFVIFAVSHFLIFRLFKDDNVLKMTIQIFLIVAIINPIGLFVIGRLSDTASAILCAIVSFTLYAIFSFFYVILIFGPNETSIRLRVLRELYNSYPNAMTHDQLFSKYNNEVILKRRLSRFKKSGDIVLKGNVYKTTSQKNPFYFIDSCTNFLKKLINPTEG